MKEEAGREGRSVVGVDILRSTVVFVLLTSAFQLALRVRGQYPSLDFLGSLRGVASAFLLVSHDLIVNVVLGSLLAAFAFAARGTPAVARYAGAAYLLVGVVFLCLAVANGLSLVHLNSPLDYTLLHYSEFFLSPDARVAVGEVLSGSDLVLPIAVTFLYAILFLRLTSGRLRGAGRTATKLRLGVAASTVALVLALLRTDSIGIGQLLQARPAVWASPIVSLLGSIDRVRVKDLYEELSPASTERVDVEGIAPRAAPLLVLDGEPPRNLAIIVMESVGEVHARAAPMPFLHGAALPSLSFGNAYSHIPATSKSMVSMMCSVYPELNYWGTLERTSTPPFDCLGEMLERHGFATGFFASADLRYDSQLDFLRDQGFDAISDYRGHADGDGRDYVDHQNEFLNATSDDATFAAALSWLDRIDERFLVVIWTNQTHYPYVHGGEESDREAYRTRYLGAVRETDERIARFADELDRRRLLDSTLVVVTADHGEEFLGERSFGHALDVKEANVKVPLHLFYRGFDGRREIPDVVGLIDLAPTVFGLLGLPGGERWQGIDQLATSRARTFFFTPYAGLKLGLRGTNEIYIYDVFERTGRAEPDGTDRDAADASRLYLKAWLEAVGRFYERAFAPALPGRGPSASGVRDEEVPAR